MEQIWEKIIIDTRLLTGEFQQDLACILLSAPDIPSDVDMQVLVQDMTKMLENPLKGYEESNRDNIKLYLDSISDRDVWNRLYDEIVEIIPFKTCTTNGTTKSSSVIFTTAKDYLYDIYYTDSDPKVSCMKYLQDVLIPLIISSSSE